MVKQTAPNATYLCFYWQAMLALLADTILFRTTFIFFRHLPPMPAVCHWSPQNGTLAGGCMVSTNYILRWDRCHSMFAVSIVSVLGFMFCCFILWWWDRQTVQEGLVVGWYSYIPANASSHNLEKRPAAVELALLHRSRNGYHCDSGKLDGCSKRWSRTGSCSASKAPVFCRYHKHAIIGCSNVFCFTLRTNDHLNLLKTWSGPISGIFHVTNLCGNVPHCYSKRFAKIIFGPLPKWQTTKTVKNNSEKIIASYSNNKPKGNLTVEKTSH